MNLYSLGVHTKLDIIQQLGYFTFSSAHNESIRMSAEQQMHNNTLCMGLSLIKIISSIIVVSVNIRKVQLLALVLHDNSLAFHYGSYVYTKYRCKWIVNKVTATTSVR